MRLFNFLRWLRFLLWRPGYFIFASPDPYADYSLRWWRVLPRAAWYMSELDIDHRAAANRW